MLGNKTQAEWEREQQDANDLGDYGYISALLFLEGTKNRAEVEKDEHFPGYLRCIIKTDPKEIPPLATDEAKALYRKLFTELAGEPEEEIIHPPVVMPDYEREFYASLAEEEYEDIIDVEASELKPADEPEPEEPEPTPEPPVSPQPQPTPPPVQQQVRYGFMPQPPVQPVQPQPVQQPQQALETPLDISDKTMLQLIYQYAYRAGLVAYFFQEPHNDLIKICYTSVDGMNQRYLDDWLDPNGSYFPQPVIIPNKAVPILYQPVIYIEENLLRDYMSWKKSPVLNPRMNEWIVGYLPDRLVTDICYSSHEIVRRLDATNCQMLKASLVAVISFLDSQHPELSGIRWEFKDYKAPDNFILTPEPIESSVRGLIFYTARQTMGVSVVFDSTANPRIQVLQKVADAAQSAQDAKDALKAKITKANPGKKVAATTKKPAPKKTTKKKSDTEQADAETIQAAAKK